MCYLNVFVTKTRLPARALRDRALAGVAACGVLVFAAQAQAGGEKKAAAPPPSRPAAAPGGGGAHLPGGMGGGAHLPGNMGGGAHLPGNMAGGAGGAHIPGNMAGGAGGAHIPGSMAGGAHMPNSMAHEPSAARSQPGSAEHAAHGYAGAGSAHAAHAGFTRPAPGHAGGAANAREAANRPGLHDERGAQHGDPRIGGGAALHTRGLVAGAAIGAGAGLAAHHMAAGYLNHPADRDIAHDRAFAAAHAGDFHARYVHDFTPAEFARWRGGDWGVGWHFGRFGWWWDVDGVWYPYAEPIYPYPLEVAALTVYADDYHDPGYPVAEGPSIPPLPAAPAVLYSCASPQGYYPAVGACSQPWQLASASPDK